MEPVTIYHNPRCGTSRRVLAQLQERGIEPLIRDYLADPPPAEELKELLEKLNLKAADLVRKQETLYKENYQGKDLSENQWLGILTEHPVLLERPIVVSGLSAIVARPAEKLSPWLDTLSGR